MSTSVTFSNPLSAAQAITIGLPNADVPVGTVMSVPDDVAAHLTSAGYVIPTGVTLLAPVTRLSGHVHIARGAGVNAFTVAPGASATSATRADGGDSGGTVSVVTSGAAAGVLFTVTYGMAYPTGIIPRVILQEADARAAAGNLFVSASTNTGFTVSCQAAVAAGTSLVGFYGFVPE